MRKVVNQASMVKEHVLNIQLTREFEVVLFIRFNISHTDIAWHSQSSTQNVFLSGTQ